MTTTSSPPYAPWVWNLSSGMWTPWTGRTTTRIRYRSARNDPRCSRGASCCSTTLRMHTPEALPAILDCLINDGYTVVPIESADPRSALHHRPHRPAIPGGNSFHYISTTWGHLNSAPIDLRPESRICSHADPSVRDSNSSAMSIFSKQSASVSLWPKVKKSTLPVAPFLIFGANEKSSCFLCENSCSFLIFIYFNCYLFKFLSIHPCICLSILK